MTEEVTSPEAQEAQTVKLTTEALNVAENLGVKPTRLAKLRDAASKVGDKLKDTFGFLKKGKEQGVGSVAMAGLILQTAEVDIRGSIQSSELPEEFVDKLLEGARKNPVGTVGGGVLGAMLGALSSRDGKDMGKKMIAGAVAGAGIGSQSEIG